MFLLVLTPTPRSPLAALCSAPKPHFPRFFVNQLSSSCSCGRGKRLKDGGRSQGVSPFHLALGPVSVEGASLAGSQLPPSVLPWFPAGAQLLLALVHHPLDSSLQLRDSSHPVVTNLRLPHYAHFILQPFPGLCVQLPMLSHLC